MYDLVVTDDSALIAFLRETGIVDPDVSVKYPATAEDVICRNVIGKLPYTLSCVALSYTEIPLHLPSALKGLKPILEDYFQYADTPVTYRVTKMYTYPGE